MDKTAVKDPDARTSNDDSKNRRRSKRIKKKIEVEIQGKRAGIRGETLDISTTGVSVRIVDEKFFSGENLSNPEECMHRIKEEFGEGLGIHFPLLKETYTTWISRFKRRGAKDAGEIVLACRFNTEMDPETFKQIARMGEKDALEREMDRPSNRKKSGDVLEGSVVDRRRAVRVRTSRRIEVMGEDTTFKAQAVNISSTGVLINIAEDELGVPYGPERIVLLNRIMTDHFRKGLAIRFLDAEFSMEANAVRVSEITLNEKQLTVIGCRFKRPLTPEECDGLNIDPSSLGRDLENQEAVAAGSAGKETGKTNIHDLMKMAVEKKATDLHIKVGGPPRMRISGALLDIGEQPITPEHAHAMACDLMTPEQASEFERSGDMEIACTVDGGGRYRVNLLRQRGHTGLAIRCLPGKVPTIESLELHPLTRTLAEKPKGLVLVTGPTGSGKSTTLAAVIDHINRTRPCHIITMEEPIEYVHEDAMAQITQREIGFDVPDFKRALRRALRQDPDVLLVGEMRDLDTISMVLTAAESGHLIFAVMHTTSAAQTPARIIDSYPKDQQPQIRLQLADTLQGIMSQILVPRKDGEGMALAQEIILVDDTVRSQIRDNKTPLTAASGTSSNRKGVQSLEAALNHLVKRGVISFETAKSRANFPARIRKK